ncbi:MAG TPA: carboxypeptidase-like regulatory domain-containing protein, partial [Terriglobia bacterium]|nr:carboxypeptidase-like regulatory domain-containing protein [Terriglobia bacterium]
GQTLSDIETILTPAGVISGRIRDREGDPVGAATVQLLIPVYQDGQRVLKPVQTAYTNDLGEYRLFGLMPGQYFLSVMPGGTSSLARIMAPATADETRIFVDMSRPLLAAGVTYVPIYYPGTADVRAATSIELVAGANQGGVNFTAAPIQTRHVRGIVPGGGATVSLVSLDPAAANVMTPNQTSTDDGPFDIRGVAPGTYLLIGHSRDLSGSLRLDVRDADIDNITLTLGSPIIIPTHVAFDDRADSGNDPDLEFLRLRLIPDPPVAKISGDSYSPFPDGRMGFEVLTGESYRIKLDSAFDGAGRLRSAYIKSIRMGMRDVLNDGLQFNGEQDPKIEVVIGMKPGNLNGTVVTMVKDKPQPVVNTTVVLVPDAARRRRPEAYKTATTDGAGRFQMDSLAPGDYLVFAWDDVENGAWQDPDFLRLYEAQGAAVRIKDGSRESVTVNLLPSR